MNNKKEIIVSMTSWKKRINNVAKVVFSILINSVKPDKIICNLSTDEFPKKEKELPENLLLLQETTCLEINWVKENTKTFKKIIPTLQKNFGKDYYLFSIDDDELYEEDYIKTGIKYLENHNVVVITKRSTSDKGVWGGMTCYNAKIFRPIFWESLAPIMIETSLDDEYINAYLKYVKESIFCCQENHTIKYNDSFPNRGKGYSKTEISRATKIANAIFD